MSTGDTDGSALHCLALTARAGRSNRAEVWLGRCARLCTHAWKVVNLDSRTVRKSNRTLHKFVSLLCLNVKCFSNENFFEMLIRHFVFLRHEWNLINPFECESANYLSISIGWDWIILLVYCFQKDPLSNIRFFVVLCNCKVFLSSFSASWHFAFGMYRLYTGELEVDIRYDIGIFYKKWRYRLSVQCIDLYSEG